MVLATLSRNYNRHSGGDFDAAAEQEELALRTFVGDMFGERIEDGIDMLSPDALLRELGRECATSRR
ncbi:MAG TPA: hypothetical protein VF670_20770 [Duganella sp.]|jgi:hypothetical protein